MTKLGNFRFVIWIQGKFIFIYLFIVLKIEH